MPEPAAGIQVVVARAVTSPDRPMIRSTTIPVIRTTNPSSWTRPPLNATGDEINMRAVVLATETIPQF